MTNLPEKTNRLPSGLSVVVPVYNSAAILPDLITRLRPVLQATGLPHELILVNDGSRDESWAVIQQLVAQQPWVRGLCLMRNYGQHNAVLCGTRAACFAITVTMDDDLQHPPEELGKLLTALTDACDVVYGTPEQESHGLTRNLSSIITKLALKSATGVTNARMFSAWRVFRTHLREAFATYHSPFVSMDVLLTWGTTRFASVPVRHDSRSMGKSNYSFGRLLRHAVNMMTGFSVMPLQLASVIGFGLTLFGVGVFGYVLTRYLLTGSSVAGFPFLASIIAIFSGAQLFALGIMGEYLARMHFRTMDKPTYCIRESIGHDS